MNYQQFIFQHYITVVQLIRAEIADIMYDSKLLVECRIIPVSKTIFEEIKIKFILIIFFFFFYFNLRTLWGFTFFFSWKKNRLKTIPEIAFTDIDHISFSLIHFAHFYNTGFVLSLIF